ncbi:MAG: helix-turn-helix transcriptional regulator [Methanofastidiosum sp.]
MRNNIGETIRNLRTERGMSQFDLATLLGYDSVTAISLIEQGKRNLSIDKLKKVSEIFNISIQDILGFEEHQKKDIQIGTALRASGDLEESDIKDIEDYIKYIKFRSDKKEGK